MPNSEALEQVMYEYMNVTFKLSTFVAMLSGFIPIAPAGLEDFDPEIFEEIQTPTMILQGRKDQGRATQGVANCLTRYVKFI